MQTAEILETSCVVDLGGSQAMDWLPTGAASPLAHRATVRLRIVKTTEGFFLHSQSDILQFSSGDTCHESLADALAQAEFQFGVPKDRWQRVAA